MQLKYINYLALKDLKCNAFPYILEDTYIPNYQMCVSSL